MEPSGGEDLGGEASDGSNAFRSPDPDAIPELQELQFAKDIFADFEKEMPKILKYTEFSNKIKIAMSIVAEAVKNNDNVLIFLHSIPTLEYLEEKLKHKKRKVYVLTGSTIIKERQHDIDRFNRDTQAVYLISCRVRTLMQRH